MTDGHLVQAIVLLMEANSTSLLTRFASSETHSELASDPQFVSQ
jgi:hypothetical protein